MNRPASRRPPRSEGDRRGYGRSMNRAVQSYAETAFPAHRLHEVRTVPTSRPGGRTVVAAYHTVGQATAAAGQLPTRAEWDDVEVFELVGPDDQRVGAPSPESQESEGPAGATTGRMGIGAGIGGVVGAVLGAVVGGLLGEGTAVTVLCVVAGLILGAVVGATVSGGAKYGGDRAEAQVSVPNNETVTVLSVWVPDENAANVVAGALGSRGPIEVKILQDGGFWHAPSGD